MFSQIIRSTGAVYVAYFIIGIFFCSFYLMNLVLAVVYLSYEQELCSDEREVIDILNKLVSFITAKWFLVGKR